ncbi:MAG TPA: SdrD B-like domain-containing protein, partial [Acidimicrobiales bacterium]
ALYQFDLDPASGALVGAGPSAIIPIPQIATDPADARPFGLGSHDGLIYVGGVDSAQLSGGTPSAWVAAFNPATTTFAVAPVARFPLAFNRGCAYVVKTALNGARCSALDGSANWRAWGTPPSSADGPDPTNGNIVRTEVDPQPMVSDIAFDDNGDMSLGFRDRFGDQSGRLIPSGSVSGVPLRITSYTFGDTLRLARTGPTFTLENNGTSGGVTGTAGDGMGPGGGEFYSGDNSLYNVTEFGVPALEGHDEVTSGALHHQPSTPELATTAYDVFGRWDTLGVRFMTDTGNDAPAGGDSTDLNVRAYALYTGTQGGTTPFGKANGLGDLEALCDQAPIELGNYVWFDANHNGIQDAGEKPIPGVKVTLAGATGVPLATAVTDSTGQYWFVSAGAPNLPSSPDASYGVVAGAIQPGTSYSMTFDASGADTQALGIAASALQITVAGQGTPTINSKPTVTGAGLPAVAVHTGGPGANDHTFDAGFAATTARISLVKSVNGDDANTPRGPTIEVPGTATFTYLVTNSGEVALTRVAVSDDKLGAITCPKTQLAVGESMTCTSAAAATAGQYTNTGTVSGTAPDGSVVTATDVANYFGQPTGVLDTTTIAGGDTTSASLTGLDAGTSHSGGSAAG